MEEKLGQSSNVLQLFWDLASLDAKKRLSAAESLISTLYLDELKHLSQLDDSTRQTFGISPSLDDIPVSLSKNMDSVEDIDILCSTEVAYSLRRLCKGLSSSREGARQGFSTALTELLKSVVPFVTPSLIIELIKAHTTIGSGLKGFEEREFMYGRIFGYAALISSGILVSSASKLEDYQTILQDLVKFSASSKPYLKPCCYDVLFALILTASKCEFYSQFVQTILNTEAEISLFEPEYKLSAELLPIVLHLQAAKDTDSSSWPHLLHVTVPENLLDIQNISAIGNAVKDSTEFAHPRIHNAVTSFLMYVCSNMPPSYIEKLWFCIVEEHLMVSNALEKKSLAFRLFQLAFPIIAGRKIPISMILPPTFVSFLLKSLDNEDSSLHKLAKSVSEPLLEHARENENLALELVAVFTGHAGSTFEKSSLVTLKVTSGKHLISKLIELSDEERNPLKMTENLVSRFITITENIDTADSYRTWCADQLGLLIRNPQLRKDPVWITSILRFFVTYAFFEQIGKTKEFVLATPPLSDDVRSHLRKRFWSLLADLCTRRIDGKEQTLETSSLGMVSNDMHVLELVVKILKEYMKASTSSRSSLKSLSIKHDKEVKTLLKKGTGLILPFDKKDDESKGRNLLLSMLTIQIMTCLSSDACEEISEIYADVIESFSRLGKEQTIDDLNPADVLCDTLVSLFSKQATDKNDESPFALSSRLVRTIGDAVFKAYCLKVSPEGFRSILRVFDPVLDSSVAVDEEGTIMEEEDVESEDSKSDDDSENEDVIDENTLKKIKAALGDQADTMDEDLPDLTDEQMVSMGFDEKLSQIFKEKKSEETDKTSLIKMILDFRTKALDLVSIFLSCSTAASSPSKEDNFVNYALLSEVSMSLLRSAAIYANPVGCMNIVRQLKIDTEHFDKIALMSQLDQLSIMTNERRLQLSNKMLKLVKNSFEKINPPKNIRQEEVDVLFECVQNIESIFTGSQENVPLEFQVIPSPSKDIVETCSYLIVMLFKQILRSTSSNPALFAESTTRIATLMERFIILHVEKTGKRTIPCGLIMMFIEKTPVPQSIPSYLDVNWKIIGKFAVDSIITGKSCGHGPELSKFHMSEFWNIASLYFKKLDILESQLSSVGKMILKAVQNIGNVGKDQKVKIARAKDILADIVSLLRKVKKSNLCFTNTVKDEIYQSVKALLKFQECADYVPITRVCKTIFAFLGYSNACSQK